MKSRRYRHTLGSSRPRRWLFGILCLLLLCTPLRALRYRQLRVPSEPQGHVVIAVVQREARFLPEWLEYHLWLGYTHFYLFNQDDDAEILSVSLRAYTAAGVVTLTPWDVGRRATAYLEALRLYSHKARSMTFLDADEFVTLPPDVRLPQALAQLGLFSTKKCVELFRWNYGDAGADSATVQRNGVLRTLTRRAGSIEIARTGKVILRGGTSARERFMITWKFIPPGWWHGCDSLTRKRFAVTARSDDAYLAHFQFRSGKDSLARRSESGTIGDFKSQAIHANKTIADYAHRNDVFDDALSRRADLVAQSIARSCACTNALGRTLRSPSKAPVKKIRSSAAMVVFIHVCPRGRWRDILLDILVEIREVGLLDVARLKIGVVGDVKVVQKFAMGLQGFDFELLHLSRNPMHWELPSINYLREFARNSRDAGDERYVLYMHTKGVRDHRDFAAKWQWRKVMQAAVVRRFQQCVELLDAGFDAVGINAVNMFMEGHEHTVKVNQSHAWHYSGNFWWASTAHMARLPFLSLDHAIDEFERCKAENFILSAIPSMCAALLWQNVRTHMYSTSDLPRGRFDDGDTAVKMVGCRGYEHDF